MKKSSPMQRAGKDIGKVLQRYLFTLIIYNEKLQYMLTNYRILFPLPSQMTAFVILWRYPCPTNPPELFHSFRGMEGDSMKLSIKGKLFEDAKWESPERH